MLSFYSAKSETLSLQSSTHSSRSNTLERPNKPNKEPGMQSRLPTHEVINSEILHKKPLFASQLARGKCFNDIYYPKIHTYTYCSVFWDFNCFHGISREKKK